MPGRPFCFMLDVIGPAPLIHNVGCEEYDN